MTRGDTIHFSGSLFEMRTEDVGGGRHYEFVERRPAVTVLPIIGEHGTGTPQALTIFNQRRGYAGSIGLPGGNLDGPIGDYEPVGEAALRELQEETGYVPHESDPGPVETFMLRPVSSTINYARLFAIVRGAHYVGGELNSDSEEIELRAQDLAEYAEQVASGQRTEQYPEISLAFAMAEREFGLESLTDWLAHGTQPEDPNDFETGYEQKFDPAIFEAYMQPIDPATHGEFPSMLWTP